MTKYYSLNEENFGRGGNITIFYKVNFKTNEGWSLAIVFPHPPLRKKPYYSLEKFTITKNYLSRKIPKRKFYKVLRSVVVSGFTRMKTMYV